MTILMQENARSGINFLLVCPSTVDTPLVHMAAENGPRFLKGIPLVWHAGPHARPGGWAPLSAV